MDHPFPWLKYLSAEELKTESINLKHARVESPSGEDLGKIDGFIVDSGSSRPYYVVVEAGGWFRSKHYLLPIGQARFDENGFKLVVDGLSRDQVKQFPGFKLAEFGAMTADDLKRINEDTLRVGTVSGVIFTYEEADPYSAAWDQPEFQTPAWWRARSPEPGSSSASVPRNPSRPESDATTPPSNRSEREERERVVARGDTSERGRGESEP